MNRAAALRWTVRALQWAALALVLLYLVRFAVRNWSLQWDGRTYWLAARAALAGLDPYRVESLSAMAGGRTVAYPFVYPPIGLLPFLPLTALPLVTALQLWMALKVVLLGALVVSWHRLAKVEWLALALVAVFGFDGSSLWDLRAGNLGILEAALVWLGLSAFIDGRRGAFSAWIVAASCFKLAPAFLLLLLLVPTAERPPSPARLLIAALALGALVWAPLWIGPAAHWSGFLSNMTEAIPVGPSNPSLLGLFYAYARGGLASEAVAMRVSVGAWLLIATLVLALSARWLIGAWRARDARRWAFAAVWIYALLAPRPMAYGLVLAAPAPLALAPRILDHPIGRLTIALILSLQGALGFSGHPVRDTFLQFAPILLALALWLLVVLPVQEAPSVARVEQVA